MNFKKNKQSQLKDRYLNKYVIEVIFILIALCYCIGWLLQKGMPMNDDIFNYLRLKDVGLSIINKQLPQFNLYTGHPLGLASNTFYPYILLLPFSLLFLFLKSNIAMGITYFLLMLLGLNITYKCSCSYYKNKISGFLLSVFYLASTIIFMQAFQNGDIGYFLVSCFLPLSFFGWLYWVKSAKWRMLTCGLTLSLFSNIPAFIITVMILIALTLINMDYLNKQKIINGLKSFGTFILCGSFFLIPIIVLEVSNKVFTPNMVGIHLIDTTRPILVKPFYYWFSPAGYSEWDLVDFLAIIFSLRYFKRLKRIEKQCLIISIIIIICCCEPIQQFLLTNTPLYSLQFLSRFCMISHFLFSLIFMRIIDFYLFKHIHNKRYYLGWIDILLTWLILCLMFSCTSQLIGTHIEKYYHPNEKISRENRLSSFYPHLETNKAAKLLPTKYDNSSFILHESLPNNYSDYAPIKTVFTYGKQSIYSSAMHVIKYRSFDAKQYNDNGIKLKLSKSTYKTIPLILFHQQKYLIKNNNKLIHYKNSLGFAKIHLHKGINKIKITTPIMWYRYIAFGLSILGFGCLIIRRKRK